VDSQVKFPRRLGLFQQNLVQIKLSERVFKIGYIRFADEAFDLDRNLFASLFSGQQAFCAQVNIDLLLPPFDLSLASLAPCVSAR
jgi:hypothetical protein